MRIFIILILELGLLVTLHSQEMFEVKPAKLLVAPNNSNIAYLNPKWAPDGRKIAFTSSNFHSIWIYDVEKNIVTKLTNEISAGFGFSWSADAKTILTRVSMFQDLRRLSAIKLFHIEKQSEEYLTEFRTDLPDIPQWTPSNDKVYLHDGQKAIFFNSNKVSINSTIQSICYHRLDKIIIENSATGEQTEFLPFTDVEYLNLTRSPNGKYLAFEVYGGNCYILNVETSELLDLGPVNYPQWSPDGQYLAYMQAEDDGHVYTASEIYITNLTGTLQQNITKNFDRMAMYPSWSPSGTQVVFNTYPEGTIEYLELKK